MWKVWIVAAALAGCGGEGESVCDKAESAAQMCEDKNPGVDTLSNSECEDRVKACNDDDRDKLGVYFGCVERADCSDASITECALGMQGVSNACIDAALSD